MLDPGVETVEVSVEICDEDPDNFLRVELVRGGN